MAKVSITWRELREHPFVEYDYIEGLAFILLMVQFGRPDI